MKVLSPWQMNKAKKISLPPSQVAFVSRTPRSASGAAQFLRRGEGREIDIYSSTAAILVRRGIAAVLAMQYEISDRAAIEFSRTFYKALAYGQPIDAAVPQPVWGQYRGK